MGPRSAGALRALLFALALTALTACSLSPPLVGTRPTTIEEARAELEASALSVDRLSDVSREVLEVFALDEAFDDDPAAALRDLHEYALQYTNRAVLFALAEGHYLVARRARDRDAYLAATVYAYFMLLGSEAPDEPNPYDRRFRWAVAIYNDGLLRALLDDDGRPSLQAGMRELPMTRLDVTLDRAALPWEREPERYEAANALAIFGLRLRLRDSGLGVPLVAHLPREPKSTRPYVQPKVAPVTVFLRLEGGLADCARGLTARLELHSGYDDETIVVDGREVPVETDRSAVLARALDDPEAWRFSVSGLFGSARAKDENRLILVQPYAPGRVPVVFVHGTASSPAYWAQTFNTLWADPALRSRTQMWFFRYTTGNPILYSAAELRDALRATVVALDPEGEDPALRRMVLIGHSQGGLLVRLLVTDGGELWVEELMGRRLEELALEQDEEELLARCIEFEPLPLVARAIFVSTPHRGSFLSDRWYSRLISRLISFPSDVMETVQGLGAQGSAASSIAAMAPKSRLVEVLARHPIAPGIPYHSIISIGDADPGDPQELATADDGVVAYPSAHLDGAASEDLVPAGHSCQGEPVTIQAIRRILREHLAALDAGAADG